MKNQGKPKGPYIKKSILMVCDKCGLMTIADREDFEKKGVLKKAVYMTDTCAWCQEPGNFYEDQWYYGEDGLIHDLE